MKTHSLRLAPIRRLSFAAWLILHGALLLGPPGIDLARAACATPPPSISHWWRGQYTAVDEIAGKAAILEAGAGYGGALVGDGFFFYSGSMARIPNDASLRPSQFTFEAWIFAFDAGTHQDVAGGVIISKDIPVAPTVAYALAGPGVTGQFIATIGLDDGSAASVTSVGSYPFLAWHHVAMTWDGSTLALYVNGTLDTQTTVAPRPICYCDDSDVGIGRHPMFGTRGFHGLIDEPTFYSTALGATDIASLHAAGADGKCRPSGTDCVDRPSDALAHWTGNGRVSDEVGIRAVDLENGATYGGGLAGQAFAFSGSSLARVPEDAQFQPAHFTFEAWIYAYDAGTHPDAAGGVIVSRDIPVAPTITYALAGPGSSGHFTASVGLVEGASMGAYSTYAYGFNRWHHVAMTWDGDVVRLFVNGRLDAEAPAPHLDLNYHPDGQVGIGRHPMFGTRGFNGLIDEPSIYSRALSAAEIQAIAVAREHGKCVSVPGPCVSDPVTPIHWWPGDGDGVDEIGALDLQTVDTVTYGPGLKGQALEFAGSGMMLVPFSDSLNQHEFTFEAWVHPRSVGSLPDALGAIIASKDTAVSSPGITFSLTGPGTDGRFRASVGLVDGSDPFIFSENPFGFTSGTTSP